MLCSVSSKKCWKIYSRFLVHTSVKPNVVFVPFKECRVNKFVVYEVFWSEKILCCEEKLSFFYQAHNWACCWIGWPWTKNNTRIKMPLYNPHIENTTFVLSPLSLFPVSFWWDLLLWRSMFLTCSYWPHLVICCVTRGLSAPLFFPFQCSLNVPWPVTLTPMM